MKKRDIKKLKEIVGEKRVSTKKRDRIPSSHDLASIPSIVKNRIDYEPDIVLQPKTREEIEEIINIAYENEIPIVPRGSGTSAYGGSVPAAGGISISFARMRGLKNLDKENKKARVEPGTIWTNPASTPMKNIDKTLQDYLKKHDLEVPAYPSSAPGSTVAGWVAEGGAGYGSYEYGEIKDIVSQVEIITSKGTKTLKGEDLDFVVGLEGTTGIISEIEINLKEKEQKIPQLIAFQNEKDAVKFLQELYKKELDLWNVTLYNPNHTKKKQEATDNTILPSEKWLVLVSYPESREINLKGLIKSKNGELLEKELAHHAWEERFFPLRYKRIGPSEMASESYVPIENLDDYINSLKELKEEVILDSKLIDDGRVYNLASVITDERAPSYMISAMTQMQMDDAAKNAGGTVYGIGMFNHSESRDHFGKKFDKIKEFKRSVDEKEIINPGKIFSPKKRGKGVKNVQRMMKMAKLAIPLKGLDSFILSSKSKIKEDKDLPEKVNYESFACSRCNYCTEVCDQWAGSKWESQSPKGRWTFLRQYLQGNESWDQEIAESFLLCTTCKRCNQVCQSDIPILEIWDDMRGSLVQEKGFGTFNGFEMMKATADIDNNIWAGREEDRNNWMPEKEEKQ
ncbi:hypothetical protein C9439_06270 [archaeon SCG-AAA382B04]|nr:hypothetical protein C9439_06270 [archaeon SCG-AAA382B04]